MSRVSTETQKRILIWSVSRALSTVLMRALSKIPDSLVLSEYLLLAGCNEVSDTLDVRVANLTKLTAEPDFTFQSWKELYEQPYPGKSVIIGKEMADTLGGRMDMIPQGYTHVFLMRHPSKSSSSLDNALSCLPPEQRFFMVNRPQFKSLAGLYEHVTKSLGQETAVVLDADDLLAKPAETLRLLCESTGMPFSQELLYWEQIKEELPTNWLMPKFLWRNGRDGVGSGIYKTAFESTCFHANKETSGAAKETDTIKPEIQELIQNALPYYESLYEHHVVVE